MAYGQIIKMLATKYSGLRWRLYDAHIHQLVSAGQHLPWVEINPSMMLADVVRSGGTSCPLCQGMKYDMTLWPLHGALSPRKWNGGQFLTIGQRMMESVVGSIDLGAVHHPDVASSTSALAVERWNMGQRGVGS